MKVLVTGAGGFLGLAITKRLIHRGDSVVGFQRGIYPELNQLGIHCIQGNLTDSTAIQKAVDGCQTVFHVAAKAGVWGKSSDYYNSNVIGTRNVIEACRTAGVQKLIYTSSPSVTFDGKDENGIDESAPYAKKYLSYYPKTKAIAEREVLQANQHGEKQLATIALRPHLLWGPDDPHLVPRIIQRAKAGKLRIVGDGNNLVDTTYIDNAAEAHLAAEKALDPSAACAGKAYFISNGQPLPMSSLINQILAAADLPPVEKYLSAKAAYRVGWMMECWFRLLGKNEEPLMTRFVARQLSTAHWYNLQAAQRDLGYQPQVSIQQGMEKLAASLSTMNNSKAVV